MSDHCKFHDEQRCLVCGFIGRREEHRMRHVPRWAPVEESTDEQKPETD